MAQSVKLSEVKAKRFVETVLKTGSPTRAMKELRPHLANSSAMTLGSLAMKSEEVRKHLSPHLDKLDGSISKMARKIIKLTDADKAIISQGERFDVPDNPTQLEAAKTVLRLHGVLRDDKGGDGDTYIDNRSIIVGADSIDRLSSALDAVRKLRQKPDNIESGGDLPD